jgi:hypothetical protein
MWPLPTLLDDEVVAMLLPWLLLFCGEEKRRRS